MAKKAKTSAQNDLTNQQYLDFYYYMRLTRSLEERLTILFKQNKVVGGLYRSLGQEATAVGSAFALRDGDVLSPLIRDMGALLVRGAKPREIFMQYMARDGEGTARGRDLNIHIADMQRGYVGPISQLGDMVAIMAGVAMGGKMQGKNIVTMVYVGDGATSTGAFHEAVNFAAVLNLPMVTIIENNGYAFSTPTEKQCLVTDFAVKAKGYGIPGETVDGNDVVAVYQASRRAVDRARNGEGSSIIEVKTFRMLGHAQHDNQSYVPKELLEQWREKDPITNYQEFLKKNNLATDDSLKAMDEKILAYLDEEVAIADKAPFPPVESCLEDVYFETPKQQK
ncbi:MAG: thiamine pyrophosphate-dependent dehydrogenase E1 component subunit alpha [Acidobacteria bacterium]|nr:thiamine pyrophosphate-dependent dehydrogenase E1 component subunit alpha [Acidobacteriota bacterium]